MPTYGQTIRWTDKDGSIRSVSVDGRGTPQQALRDAIKSAIGFGWTYPKWFQWWRKYDTRPDLSLIDD